MKADQVAEMLSSVRLGEEDTVTGEEEEDADLSSFKRITSMPMILRPALQLMKEERTMDRAIAHVVMIPRRTVLRDVSLASMSPRPTI
eukprot:CAMPEP_0181039976 /NCGR_PEP_ID=MMETSP1070-20121207/10787_1 /TAXON_ID=265543 /ORGANISM="Minutocellus polymorphus, Strain NH13" /LENGTH=87 /DNA_ID=CAMNT_0023117925 /DNA_START=327 /DNA_END=590 /DNA_ORIENTATION=+